MDSLQRDAVQVGICVPGESRFIGESYRCRGGRGTPNSLINSRSHEYGRNRGYAIVNHAIALYGDPGRVLIVINRIRDR